MIGISELKSSSLTFLVLVPLLSFSCKEESGISENTDDTTKEYQTNIRFATISDGYLEKDTFTRLITGKTEITSTHFQMEGPAWENENVAFRNYFDTRNGMDIFGKRKKENVLDSVGIEENYHELQDWGMDILKVGNSLGAGAVGMIIGDSLFRIGANSKGTFRIISEMPAKSTLEFSFNDWHVQDRVYNVIHRVSISRGTHYYTGNLEVEGLQGDEKLVAGIVDHGVGSELFDTGDFQIVSTFGDQDVEGKSLGMAIAAPRNSYLEYKKASDYKGAVAQTHLVLLNREDAEYHFFAGWELEDSRFAKNDFFHQTIASELKAISN